jgi:hypothetical protein
VVLSHTLESYASSVLVWRQLERLMSDGPSPIFASPLRNGLLIIANISGTDRDISGNGTPGTVRK